MTNTTALDLDRQRAEFEDQLMNRFPSWDKKRNMDGQYTWSRAREEWAEVERRSNAGEAAAGQRPAHLAHDNNGTGCVVLGRQAEAQASADDILHATAKRICDRWDAEVPSEEISEEHRDLRAALAAKGQQEPVAWMVLARANGHVLGMYTTEKDAAVTARWADIAEVRPLYAAPVAQQSEAGAQDAARYRFLREHWVSFSAAPPLSNLHWKGDKLDAKVDAAILEGGAHG